MSTTDPSTVNSVVRFEGVTLFYENKDNSRFVVLEDLNFSIKGKLIVLMGASGCGKSTILRCISGLQIPNEGSVFVNDKLVEETQGVGMVFQTPMGFEWRKVIDNVAFALELRGVSQKARRQQAMDMLEMVGLAEHAYKHCKEPDLSGGQLQRVAIARSLMADPHLLLLDEPFGKLDVHTRMVMEIVLNDLFIKLTKISPLTTFLMVTHDVAEAVFLGDEVWIMQAKPGKIAHKITIPFGNDRDITIKRTKEFNEYVLQIEDHILSLGDLQSK